ncbi:Efflux RND transporter periplasmic adaptor subunit [Rhodovastum atsumiense]|uniref:Efflux RND transporter periplasmic adaptor subunit n=1 Tax=Rhodovastum atsumiense TaxID=504468 RepID=A0A5M6IJA2_9PROT|nr:efflux RND transporter periplasmic adaptor subunit [Rhodovastum atsumiense]KAA5608346.1 efflux RND transporter periplasmic adaptor subunit [Rhodovastum atsumiense]CAH2602340.1 Efflux RND transporter periplasmic adaptor subunit [Rhodovastum atsumiense]
MARSRVCLVSLAVALLAGCDREPATKIVEVRPVRTIVAASQPAGEMVVLTGHVQAQDEASIGFRIAGRMIERSVNIGDRVEMGQVLAKLDPETEVNGLRSAQAALSAAQAQLTQSRAAFERQRSLLATGHTPRAQFDLAEKAMLNAQAAVDDAEAQLRIAGRRVRYTVLVADAPGTVTARGAEPGEVVQAGQMIVQLARQGGRDAVFDVPASLLRSAPADSEVTVRLTDDAAIVASGRVREVAPQADPVTRTFLVRVGLADPPGAMRLGSTVSGSVQIDTAPVVSIPASALTRVNQQPAIWIVDPNNLTVALRNIELLRFDPGTVVVAHGLEPGEIVVVAGVQALHPGQKVRLLGPQV